VRAYVGITDPAWYQHLRAMPQLDEINFWKPGGRQRFGALKPGELFLFKLHSPDNYIVGGGLFTYSTILPVSLAWESFRSANGAPSFDEMRRRIAQYRKSPTASFEDFAVGCVLLAKPFFLREPDWIPIPADWARGIQQGKGYDLDREPGASLFRQVERSLSREASGSGAGMRARDMHDDLSNRYGKPILVAPRLGQGAFRVVVTDAYERRCAITGEKVLPVLQAAHIRPFAREGPHRVQNGILLRSDLHTLFDRGYMTVTPELRLEVSHRLHEDFDNGRDYYALHGNPLRVPTKSDARPASEFLLWHNDNAFRG
jgi:putative restriction endonuclease